MLWKCTKQHIQLPMCAWSRLGQTLQVLHKMSECASSFLMALRHTRKPLNAFNARLKIIQRPLTHWNCTLQDVHDTRIDYTEIHNQQTYLVINMELIVISIILQTLATVASHFASLRVGNISHHIFKMDHGCTMLCYKILWLCED